MKHWNKVLLFTVATVLAAVFISCKPVTGGTQGGGAEKSAGRTYC